VTVYLHEIVYATPGQEEPYMAAVLGLTAYEPLAAGETGYFVQFGLFRTTEVSGRWPCVINIWEMTDWPQFTNNLRLQFTDVRDTYMEDWWLRSLVLRRGGFDRVLLPSDYSPKLADLVSAGTKAQVVLQEIVQVPFGEAEDYLARMAETILAVAGARGWSLLGAYRVAMRPCEVVVLWGMPTWADLSDFLSNARDPLVGRWLAYRREVVTRSEELILLPGRLNPLRTAG
jgi:hypothetical protein